MTLAQLKFNIQTANMQGMAPLSNGKLEVYQQMAFDWILKLCEPLNLLISYRDKDIYRAVDDNWYLKRPVIAKGDDEYIDIDSRLDLPFTYIIIHFLGMNEVARMKRGEAYRLVVEYSNNVSELGYSKAKRLYAQESYITAVNFDRHGKFYWVDENFVKLVVDVLLCHNRCMDSSMYTQITKYKLYLTGIVDAQNRESMRAVDSAVFEYLLKNPKYFNDYDAEALNNITTLFEKLCNAEPDVEALDKRLVDNVCCIENHERGCMDER